MATFYADTSGNFLGYARTEAELLEFFPSPPVGTIFTITFDETTNPSLASDIALNSRLYNAPGGTLQKSGVTQSITAPGADFSIQAALAAGFTEAQIQANINALWNGTATTVQEQKSVAVLLYLLHAKGII